MVVVLALVCVKRGEGIELKWWIGGKDADEVFSQ